MLSLWLRRLSTDRIARSREASPAPLVVYGKRGNADVQPEAWAEWLLAQA